jgi:uncharacterized protein
MKAIISSFLIGSIFGFGLAISEMINPTRVIGFLDVTGQWDPTLLAVMGGALLITASLFPLILRRNRALLGERLVLPTKTKMDTPLILGAVIFGIGWGLAGLCPGPALAGLASASPSLAGFVIAMIGGQWLVWMWEKT